MVDAADEPLLPCEVDLLIDGLSDDVSFSWALINLGIRDNPPVQDSPPSAEMIVRAFDHFERLVDLGLVNIGRIEFIDPDRPPNAVGPVRHIAEPLAQVRRRVDHACAADGDSIGWQFSCWLVNTEAGDAAARLAILERP